jgi:hypothetical protein
MLFNPGIVVEEPVALLATVFIILIAKSIAAYLVVRLYDHSSATALIIAASLAQIGEFSFILAGLGLSLKILPEQGRDLILAGAIITILLNPLLFAALDVILARREKLLAEAAEQPELEATPTREPIRPTTLKGHVVLIGHGIFSHSADFGHLMPDTLQDTRMAVSELGWMGVIVIFLRAYSLGGGTFTGIEAVSNSTEILREPRVETGKRTMFYMAVSLAFTAGGILLCYLLNDVQHQAGRTLNASLWDTITQDWHVGGLDIGTGLVWFTKILTDPFHDIMLYHKAPLYLMRGELIEPAKQHA